MAQALDLRVSKGERIVSGAQLDELEQLGLRRIRQAAKDGSLLQQQFLGGLLYRWQDWASNEEVRSWVSDVIATDDGLLRILEAFLRVGWSSDRGRTEEVSPSELGNFVDVGSLEERARHLLSRDLSTRESAAVRAFLRNF